MMINLISHLMEEKSGRFSLNMVLDIFRNLHNINLPCGIVCMDRRVAYSANSEFIYAETQEAILLPRVKSLSTICQNIIDLNTNVLHFAMSKSF